MFKISSSSLGLLHKLPQSSSLHQGQFKLVKIRLKLDSKKQTEDSSTLLLIILYSRMLFQICLKISQTHLHFVKTLWGALRLFSESPRLSGSLINTITDYISRLFNFSILIHNSKDQLKTSSLLLIIQYSRMLFQIRLKLNQTLLHFVKTLCGTLRLFSESLRLSESLIKTILGLSNFSILIHNSIRLFRLV